MVKTITCNLFVYTIRELDSVHMGELECFGTIDHAIGELEIDKRLPPVKKQHTIIHEAMHSYDHQYGLGLAETQVQGLATAVYDFIKRNREFVRGI